MKTLLAMVSMLLILVPATQGQVSYFDGLSPEEMDLVQRAAAVFRPDLLPTGSPYLHRRAICGTPIVQELKAAWPQLSKRSRDVLGLQFTRPTRHYQVVSGSGHFTIHYDLAGRHAVAQTDDNQNGVPDYVDRTAEIFDEVRETEINQLGYRPPPSDGDDFYDVYVTDLAPEYSYGYTYGDAGFGDLKSSSYIEIDNDYADHIYFTRGLDGLRVSAAHEFYHAIQFGYYADTAASWWQEVTGVWIEDVVYDRVNDYYQYLGGFFDSPEKSLDDIAGLHVWGASVFAHHLEQVYGAGSIKRTWETLSEREPARYRIHEIDLGMPPGGFAGVLPRFAVWNYFTQDRSRPGFYNEAESYPLVKTRVIDFGAGSQASGSGRIDHLGMDYLQISTKGRPGGLRVDFDLSNSATWQIIVLLIRPAGVELVYPVQGQVDIPDIERFDEIVLIPVVTSLNGRGHSYEYTLSLDPTVGHATALVGDFNRDGETGFADFLIFAEGFGKKPTGQASTLRLDLNGDGKVNFGDFLIFASHFGEGI